MPKFVRQTISPVSPNENVPLNNPVWNRLADAALYTESQRNLETTDIQPIPPWGTAVKAVNYSGTNLVRGQVLGLSAPFYPLNSQVEQLYSDLVMRGDLPEDPTHFGRLGICHRPINNGYAGQVFVSGTCVAKVKMVDLGHTTADVSEAEHNMKSRASRGNWRILNHNVSVAGNVGDAVVQHVGYPTKDESTTGAMAWAWGAVGVVRDSTFPFSLGYNDKSDPDNILTLTTGTISVVEAGNYHITTQISLDNISNTEYTDPDLDPNRVWFETAVIRHALTGRDLTGSVRAVMWVNAQQNVGSTQNYTVDTPGDNLTLVGTQSLNAGANVPLEISSSGILKIPVSYQYNTTYIKLG